MQEGDGLLLSGTSQTGAEALSSAAELDGASAHEESTPPRISSFDEELLHRDADGALRAWCRGCIKQFQEAHWLLSMCGVTAALLAAGTSITVLLLEISDLPSYYSGSMLLPNLQVISVALSALLMVGAAAGLTAQMRASAVPPELLLANERRTVYRVQLQEARRALLSGPLGLILLASAIPAIVQAAHAQHFYTSTIPYSVLAATCTYLPWLYFLSELQIGLTLRFPPRFRNNLIISMPVLLGLLSVCSIHIGAMTTQSPVLVPLIKGTDHLPLMGLLGTVSGTLLSFGLWRSALRSLKPARWLPLYAAIVSGYILLSAALFDLSRFRDFLIGPACILGSLSLGSLSTFGGNRGVRLADGSHDWDWLPSIFDMQLYVCPEVILPFLIALPLAILYFAACIWFIHRENERVPDGWRGIWEDE